MPRLALRLLGPWELKRRDGSPVALTNRKAQALISYLALHPGKSRNRDALAALFWDETANEQARANLRQVLLSLRRSLGEESAALLTDGELVTLDAERLDVDVAMFERRLDLATRSDLSAAATLYRGPLLDGFSVRGGTFADWLSVERARLHDLAMQGMSHLLSLDEDAEDAEAGVKTALRMVALDAADEEAHRALMRFYARCGRRAAALRQYHRCAESLRRELDVEPAAETTELYRQILASPQPMSWTARPVANHNRAPRPARSATAGVEAWIRATTSRPRIGGIVEFNRLLELLDAAAGGETRSALLLGEAGIGKSRLAAELAVAGAERGCQVLLGRCHEMEQIFAFSPWIDLLRSADPAAIRGAAAGLGTVWRRSLARLLPEHGLATAIQSDSEADLIRLFEAVMHLLAGFAAERPLILLLEDFQWADSMSLRLLVFLCSRLSDSPIMLVVTIRHEDLAANSALVGSISDLTRRHLLATVEMPRLSRTETSSLTRLLLSAPREQDGFAALASEAWEVGQGNPFFIHEIVQGFIEDGRKDPSEGPMVPRGVRDLVEARLDRLSDDAQQMAAFLAAADHGADQTLLAAAAGLDQPRAVAAIEELVHRRVLRLVGESLEFTHDVIRRVAYGRLLGPRRMLIHRRIAEAFEALRGGELDEHAPILGHHYRLAEIWDKALPWLLQAGRQSVARAAYREATVWFVQALDAVDRLPKSREKLAQEIDIRIALCEAQIPAGDVRKVSDNLASAAKLAATLDNQTTLARINLYMANRHWLSGQYEKASTCGGFAAAVAQRNDDLGLRIASGFYLGQVDLFRGEYRAAVERFAGTIALLPPNRLERHLGLPGLPDVICRAWLVWGLAELGSFREGYDPAQDAIRLAEEADHSFSMADAYRAVGLFHLREGAFDRAMIILERGMALCRSRGLELWFPSLTAALGHAWTLAGRGEAALPLLEQAVQSAAAHEIAAGQSIRIAWLARANLELGRKHVADDLARTALDLAASRGEKGYEAWILELMAEIAARSQRRDTADRCFRAAKDLAAGLGMRPLVAHCQLGLGQLCLDTAEASSLLSASVRLFRDMGATRWTERAEAAAGVIGAAIGERA